MQPQFTSPHAGKVALRGGIAVGILLGTIHSVVTIVNTIQNANGAVYANASSTLFYLITPLIWIVGLLVAGTWASKMTGKVSTGTLAGLFAGLFGGLVAGFGQAIATAISVSLVQPGPYGYPGAGAVSLGAFTIIYTLFLAVGAGAGCGALGGLIGQSISDTRLQAMAQPHPPLAHPPTPVYQPPTPVYQPPTDQPYGYMPQEHTPRPRYQEIEIHLPEQ